MTVKVYGFYSYCQIGVLICISQKTSVVYYHRVIPSLKEEMFKFTFCVYTFNFQAQIDLIQPDPLFGSPICSPVLLNS